MKKVRDYKQGALRSCRFRFVLRTGIGTKRIMSSCRVGKTRSLRANNALDVAMMEMQSVDLGGPTSPFLHCIFLNCNVQ